MEVGVDAYVSVADVTAYLTARGQQAAWSAASQPQQEAAIVEATSFLDAAFSWVGKIEDYDQPLGWPRICAYDREHRPLTGIPAAVADACAELANLALGGRLMPMAVSQGGFAVKQERIGDVEVQYDTARQAEYYEYVRLMLRGIGSLTTGNTMTKLVRA